MSERIARPYIRLPGGRGRRNNAIARGMQRHANFSAIRIQRAYRAARADQLAAIAYRNVRRRQATGRELFRARKQRMMKHLGLGRGIRGKWERAYNYKNKS